MRQVECCYASCIHVAEPRPDHIGPATAGDGSRGGFVAQQRWDWRTCARQGTRRGNFPPSHAPQQAVRCRLRSKLSPDEPGTKVFKPLAWEATIFFYFQAAARPLRGGRVCLGFLQTPARWCLPRTPHNHNARGAATERLFTPTLLDWLGMSCENRRAPCDAPFKASGRVPVAPLTPVRWDSQPCIEAGSRVSGLQGQTTARTEIRRTYKSASRSNRRGGCRPSEYAPGFLSAGRASQYTHGSSDVGMAAASVASMRSVVSPSPSLDAPCQSHQGGVRAAADEVENAAEAAPPPPLSAAPAVRPLPPTPASRPKPAPSSRTLSNFRVWILCDGSAPLVARFILASFDIPEDGGVDAVRRALRASALAAPPYNVFVRPWARVAYVKAAEVGDGIRRLDNKQSDTMRALLAEEARSPGGMVLCVEQTRNPKYKGEIGSPDAPGQTTVRFVLVLTFDPAARFGAGGHLQVLGRVNIGGGAWAVTPRFPVLGW